MKQIKSMPSRSKKTSRKTASRVGGKGLKGDRKSTTPSGGKQASLGSTRPHLKLWETTNDEEPDGINALEIPVIPRETAESSTPLGIYMREAGEVPLLTVQEEVKLARRIQRGDATAREHMIRANLRLVVKIARDYENFGLPLLDLISEGNIGLMHAVERFDPTKGAKLSTYAAWWIKQQMRRALANQGKTIRLPVHVVDKIARMRRAIDEHVEAHGTQPSDDHLAKELKTTAKKVRLMRRSAMRPSSLDAPLSHEGSSQLGEIVPDQAAENAYEELEYKTRVTLLMELMRNLNEREAAIIAMRFGLNGGDEMTLEDVGVKFGVTRERIRQLQNEALHKLRRLLEEREKLPADPAQN